MVPPVASVEVNFQRVRPVFEVICNAGNRGGQLAWLAHRDEARVEPVSQRRAKDESARLDAQDQVNLVLDVVRRQQVNQLGKAGFVFEERGDVVKKNPGLGEIGHRAHQRLQVVHIELLCFFWHGVRPLLS